MKKYLLAITMLFACASASADNHLPFNVLTRDSGVVVDIRAEADNVWIKLASAYTSDNLVVRISDKSRDYYRPWFHGEVDLVSTGFRGNDVWSDRVQTSARYIEYWHGENLILHLERK